MTPRNKETRAEAATGSPARLFATLGGALLTILGVAGFFASADFGDPGKAGDALGIFAVNGWHNLLHVVIGALGILAAGFAARSYSLGAGAILLFLGAWGFAAGDGGTVSETFPVNTADNLLHTGLGLLGLGAGLTELRRERARNPRKSKRSRPGPSREKSPSRQAPKARKARKAKG